MKRRTLLAAALSAPAIAHAQPAWPTRPIRWIVPFAPGGGTDTVSRLIADQPQPEEVRQPQQLANRAAVFLRGIH